MSQHPIMTRTNPGSMVRNWCKLWSNYSTSLYDMPVVEKLVSKSRIPQCLLNMFEHVWTYPQISKVKPTILPRPHHMRTGHSAWCYERCFRSGLAFTFHLGFSHNHTYMEFKWMGCNGDNTALKYPKKTMFFGTNHDLFPTGWNGEPHFQTQNPFWLRNVFAPEPPQILVVSGCFPQWNIKFLG